MFIEEILKLNLKPDEAEILKKYEVLLEEILRSLSDGCLGDVESEDIAFASDVLLRLNTDKELY